MVQASSAESAMADKKMTIWEHLDELRARLVKAIIAYMIGATVAWTYREPILAWLWKPFAQSWRDAGIQGDPAINFAAPSDIFTAYFKLALIGGLLLAAPVMFYQLWAYVAPGLYKKEKKIVIPFVFFSTFLFVGGGLFGWRVAFPITFKWFLDLARGESTDPTVLIIRPVVMLPQYLDFVGQMLLGFGIVFELPIFILFLSIVGVVNYLQLIRFGRWFVLVAFTVAAIFTPPDTTSQIVMAVPMCLLYVVSIGLAFLFGKRPSKEEIARARAERAARRKSKLAAREAAKKRKKDEEKGD
jgi:sec-independent protein translocase protein TatC